MWFIAGWLFRANSRLIKAANLLSAHLKRHLRGISWPRFELVRRKRAGGEPACPHIVQPRFPRQAVALVCGRYRE